MKRKVIAFLLSTTMTFSISINTFAYTFKDTRKFYQEIEDVTDLGFFDCESLYFQPDTIVTRYMATEVMYTLTFNGALDYEYEFYDDTTYTDSELLAWYPRLTLDFAIENKILDGIVSKSFEPNAPVTYGEITTMLIRTLNLNDNINIDTTGNDYMEIGKKLGFFDGLDAKKDSFINYEDLAKLLHNLLKQPLTDSNLSLMETDFKSLYKEIQDLEKNIANLKELMSDPTYAKEVEEDVLISMLNDISSIHMDSLCDFNHGLYLKQALKVDKDYNPLYISTFLTKYEDLLIALKYASELDYTPIQIYLGEYENYINLIFVDDFEETEYTNDFTTNLNKRISEMMSEKLSAAKKLVQNNPISNTVENYIKDIENLVDTAIYTFNNFDKNNIDLNYYEALSENITNKSYSLINLLYSDYLSEYKYTQLDELLEVVFPVIYVLDEIILYYSSNNYNLNIDISEFMYLNDLYIYENQGISLFESINKLLNNIRSIS